MHAQYKFNSFLEGVEVKKEKEAIEAMLWVKERNGIRCFACARKCFISKDKRGYCLIRENRNNKLFALNFGKILYLNLEHIEKTPLFHFFPESKVLSFSSPGDNFPPEADKIFKDKDQKELKGEDYIPEKIVKIAEEKHVSSIVYNSEPFIFFEFAYRTAKLAYRSNIKNIFVTNAYTTEDAVKKVSKYLNAILVNLKASADPQFYSNFLEIKDTSFIFDALRQAKKHRVHIEVADLVIPQVGDNLDQCRKLTQWISNELGSDIPFHVLQFYPDNKLKELPPTPVATLERCIEEARKTGLRYVYIGNVPGHPDENTYCYNCRELLIKREGSLVKKKNLLKDRCPNCGFKTSIVI